MDFLNKAFSQLNDLFRSMSPGGRITAGLLLVVAVVSVGYLFQSQVSGGDVDLFGGASIPTPTLQKMEEAFGKAGLNNFTIDGVRVKVPRAQRAAYLAALADAKALPPNFGDKMNAANEGGMWDDPKTRERKHLQGLIDDLSLAISCMKGIERASVVNIDSQPQPGLGQAPLKTASVFASAIGGVPLDDEQVEKICNLVAAANAGMNPENVTIADANGPARVGMPRSAGVADDSYAHAVRTAEAYWNQKIHAALVQLQNVTVTSTVVLDHEKGSHTVEVKNDPKPVPVKTQEFSRSMNRDSTAAGGAPGMGAQAGSVNQPATLASAGGKSGNETNEESKNEQINVVGTTSTEKESDGRAIKSVKVAIGIPASYYEKVWRENNPTAAADDPKKKGDIDQIRKEIIQNVTGHVATLLPSPDGKDQTANVTVTTFQDIKLAEPAGPGIPQRALSWLGENWPMLAMVGLVLASLGMLRSALKSVPASAAPAGYPPGGPAAISARIQAAENTAAEKEEAVEVTAARRLRRMTGTGPSLRDELSDLVKEDPDSAANILRTWIGQAN